MNTSVKRGISVLLEGLDGVGKTTQFNLLGDRLSASLLKTPPEIINPFRNYFVNEKEEYREAYYMLGNVISSKEMTRLTENGTNVVIDRLYPSTMAYIHGKDLSYNIPESPYQWPDIIDKPDYIFLLKLNNNTRLNRLANRGDMTKEEIYIKNNPLISERINIMYERLGCIPINIEDDWDPNRVIDEICKHIKELN